MVVAIFLASGGMAVLQPAAGWDLLVFSIFPCLFLALFCLCFSAEVLSIGLFVLSRSADWPDVASSSSRRLILALVVVLGWAGLAASVDRAGGPDQPVAPRRLW